MDNYLQRGDVLDVVLTAAVLTGGPVVIGNTLGVAQKDGEIGDTVPCLIEGVVYLPLASGGGDPAIGDVVNYDESAGEVSVAVLAVAGDINGIGIVAENGAAAADTVLAVKLTPNTGTVV